MLRVIRGPRRVGVFLLTLVAMNAGTAKGQTAHRLLARTALHG